MMFFGVQIFAVGRLIGRSTLLPRALGLLLIVAGPSYVLGALATLLSPPLGAVLMPAVMAFSLVAEGSLTAWLLVKGVNAERWTDA